MKGSLVIVICFVAGVVLGRVWGMPGWMTGWDPALVVLCGLMFLVGVSVGHDGGVGRALRQTGWRVLLVPAGTWLGTWLGTALVGWLAVDRSVADCLAVGSGFGYYSLSAVIISEYKGAELGTVALVSNILRELVALLGAPWLVRWFGRLSVVSVGGATTADTTLPVIARCSGKEFVAVAVVHGILVDLSVPFLVTFFCSL